MTVNTIKYEDEMKKSYIDYAMSVIVQRALPDIRDGLKPVHRRILYTMKELGNFHDKPHKKSARIVGDVLGKYHPHGDSSVYDAMVRLAQDFNMQAPLVDGHGNFGSIDGDSAAAMRYTEARLSPLANELLRDLDIGIVEMMPNFDNTLKEPKVLPTRFPHLLVNGSSGIAVGMATSIPPHNLKEVIDATMALLDRPQLTIAQLMKYLPGPDFPTGGIISNKEDLLDVYETGRGKLKVRAKIEKEGKKNLVVTEIPYTLAGNKTKILEDIIKLMTERRFDEISDIFDESSKDGLRIVIELKRGADQDMVMNKLFKLTKLEDTFGVNLLAIKDKSPISFSLKGMIEEYIAFLKEIHHKRLTHDLNKLQSRKEVLDGLIKATDMIDLIIEILRGSKDLKTAKDCLITGKTERITFKTKKSEKEAGKMCFTEIQASAILTMQLQRLIGLELEKLEKEKGEIGVQIDVIETILSTEENFHNHLKDDLKRIKKTYGKKRLTQIDTLELSEIPEKEIPVEDLYALIDKFGYLKLVDSMSFNRMAHDGYERIIPVKSNETLKFFTYDGMMSQIKLSDMEISKSKDRGTPIDVLVDTSIDNVALIESGFDKVMFTTLKGFIKIVDASEFATRNKTIKATKLSDGDRIISVIPVMEEHKEVVITTKEKRELRFMVGEIPEQKKTAVGVVGINLNANDEVDKAELTQETEEKKRKRGAKGLAI